MPFIIEFYTALDVAFVILIGIIVLIAQLATHKCPACKKKSPKDQILCEECGYNFANCQINFKRDTK